MNNLEKHIDQLIEQTPVNFETPPEAGSQSASDLLKSILRRWYIVLLVFFVMCATGLPAIWLLIKPLYSVTGAIRVAPILTNIITGETDKGEISNYQMFIQTQAEMVTSEQVLQRVADDLADRNLPAFEKQITDLEAKIKQTLSRTRAAPDLATKLKEAIFKKVITIGAERNSELIKITLKSIDSDETRQIVDSFIRNYMAVEVSSDTEEGGRKLTVLEGESKLLAEKLRSQREAIRLLAQEFGSSDVKGRYEMKLKRVEGLLNELTQIETRRINLEAQVQSLEQTAGQVSIPENMMRMKLEYINKDPTIEALTANIVQLELKLITAGQNLTATNPQGKRLVEQLETTKKSLNERKEEVGKIFDDLIAKERKSELEQTKMHENRLREMLAKEDTETIELGRKQLTINDLEDQMKLTKEIYDQINRRTQELEMERKRPARISVAYYADISDIRDKRVKYTAALIVGALACGTALAYLRDKSDKTLRAPTDIIKRLDIRVIGTTTSLHSIKPALLPAQMAGDYQTIRANLGLFDHGGMPKKLVVTSPGMREGKTTFAINLATSIAKSGKKVLLIDGDLRKPDIALVLNLPQDTKGLQALLSGVEFDQAVYCTPSTGLNVLASHSNNDSNAYELITSPLIAQYVNKLSENYDHIIIDTPPVLAFPDALVWAKIAGSVILTSFAGQTTAPDLREAKQRLMQINVRVLGTVLSNARADHSYYRYDYNYPQKTRLRKKSKRVNTNLLLPPKAEKSVLPKPSPSTITEIQTSKQNDKTDSKDVKS